MQRSLFIRRLATALLALGLGVGACPRSVLCIGTNGHLAIEPIAASCCHSPRPEEHTIGERDTGCATSCTDTPLGLSPASRAPERFHGHAPLVAMVSAVPLHPHGARRAAMAFQPIRCRAILTPRRLRTTVDLC